MKTIRFLVILLLASVHVCTSDLSHESVEPTVGTGQQTSPAPAPADAKLSPTAPAGPATQTAAPHAPQTATPTVAPAQPHLSLTDAPDKKTETPTPVPKTASTTESTDNKTETAPSLDKGNNETSTNDTLKPRTPQVQILPDGGNSSESETLPLTPGPDDTIEKPSSGTDAAPPTPASQTIAPSGVPHQTEKNKDKSAGPQPGTEEKEPTKSDKRLWWILLPALLVGAAAAIVLKFKCKKIHNHTETIDTGTENASFQSRPESTKDGVMLLGVKSSGGDENAAAR